MCVYVCEGVCVCVSVCMCVCVRARVCVTDPDDKVGIVAHEEEQLVEEVEQQPVQVVSCSHKQCVRSTEPKFGSLCQFQPKFALRNLPILVKQQTRTTDKECGRMTIL